MPERECRNCRFWAGTRDEEYETAACRRRAPVKEPKSAYAPWPQVGQTEYCGDWNPMFEETPDDE